MSSIPSPTDLERLTDSELRNRMNETLQLIKQGDSEKRPARDQLYRLLENEQIRRMLASEAKAVSDMLKRPPTSYNGSECISD